MAVPHTRVAVSPPGRAKWRLSGSKVEGLDSPVTCANAHAQGVQDLSVEGESNFLKTLTRAVHPRADIFMLSRWRQQLIQLRIQLIRQRDSCSRQKVVPLFRKSYHFWKSHTTFSPVQLTHAREQLSRTREQLTHACISCSQRWLSCIFRREVTSLTHNT